MRMGRLILWDMKFQMKYGFYFLYAVLTVVYLILLSALPESWRGRTAAILIFSDPAAMGLFFMGAIVLLEKSQRVPCALAVSPIRAGEYVAAKLVSLSVVSLLVAAVIAIAAGTEHIILVLLGTALAGASFTLLGIIIASKIGSLNQFILATLPVEILGFVPVLLHLFGVAPWLKYYPFSCCMDLIAGKQPSAAGIVMMVILLILLWIFSLRCVLKMWRSLGGVKL